VLDVCVCACAHVCVCVCAAMLLWQPLSAACACARVCAAPLLLMHPVCSPARPPRPPRPPRMHVGGASSGAAGAALQHGLQVLFSAMSRRAPAGPMQASSPVHLERAHPRGRVYLWPARSGWPAGAGGLSMGDCHTSAGVFFFLQEAAGGSCVRLG
jgi:hypothetical protein